MKKYLLPVAMLITIFSFAQKKDSPDLDKITKQIDSTSKNIEAAWEQQYKEMKERETKRMLEQNNRNLEAFMQMQREQQEKQKRSNWIRIGIGLLFFGVLIFGWMRKRKKTK